MKISKLIKRINKIGRHVAKYIAPDVDKTVWIGSRYAIYPLYDMPYLKTGNQILTLLDIPRHEHVRYNVEPVTGNAAVNITTALDKARDPGYQVDRLETTIIKDSDTYIVFRTPDGLKFINSKDMEIAELSEEYWYYYKGYIVVKAGMLPVAVICTCNPAAEGMVEEARATFNILSEALIAKQAEEAATASKSAAQTTLDDFYDGCPKD